MEAVPGDVDLDGDTILHCSLLSARSRAWLDSPAAHSEWHLTPCSRITARLRVGVVRTRVYHPGKGAYGWHAASTAAWQNGKFPSARRTQRPKPVRTRDSSA